MIFIEMEQKKKSCGYIVSLSSSRDGADGIAGRLQVCFISLTIPASFTSTQWGQMMLKRPLRKSREEDCCKVWEL